MLEVKDLSCGYEGKSVLRRVSFNVQKEEFCGIIGPNGSGKTTLLRAITKVIKPQNGEITFNGEEIASMSFRQLAHKAAVVSQIQPHVFDMTVEDFILMGRIPYYRKLQFFETGSDEKIVNRAMELTDTSRFKERFIGEMSGGERQLVVIAKALAQEPKLLLLDEPTAHLDITHQVRILDLLKRLNRKKQLTVITVLHNLNLASEYCDKLILLNQGTVQKIGSPQDVLTYKIIEDVYKTTVVVKKNPVSSKPHILIVSEEGKKRWEKPAKDSRK
jgi:iron complex transport system ATP-binding protein